jgi:non-homologous end joining protein Ku
MRGKAMVALGRLVLSKRERVIVLEPYGKGLLATTVRYPYEVRNAEDYFCARLFKPISELQRALPCLTCYKPTRDLL